MEAKDWSLAKCLPIWFSLFFLLLLFDWPNRRDWNVKTRVRVYTITFCCVVYMNVTVDWLNDGYNFASPSLILCAIVLFLAEGGFCLAIYDRSRQSCPPCGVRLIDVYRKSTSPFQTGGRMSVWSVAQYFIFILPDEPSEQKKMTGLRSMTVIVSGGFLRSIAIEYTDAVGEHIFGH